MADTQKSRHSLAGLNRPSTRVDLQFRDTDLQARAVYYSRGMKVSSSMQVRIVKLSTAGAILQGELLPFLTDQFYLVLGDREIFITCAKRHFADGKMAVAFASLEHREFIDALARITEPQTTLKQLRGATPMIIESRITARYAV